MSVRDGFEAYYAEKIWRLVPEVYRDEDGQGANPGVLRRIVGLIGVEAARTRRSIDRLWEDQFAETADDWAVPYIADLVGARLVSALDPRGRRVDTANAVRFRRRRGTPDLLDSLVRAMSGWDVVLVEGFTRLSRTRHRLDPAPTAGRFFTSTLKAGTAELRNPVGAELAHGPFNEYFHTLDTRLLRGLDGRYGPTKLNFHLYRLQAFEVTGSDPVELTDPAGEGFLRTFTIDPSGRDVPLFLEAQPPDDDEIADLPGQLSRPSCGNLREWEVTQPMRRRLLGHTAYLMNESILEQLRQAPNPPLAADEPALLKILGVRFPSEPALRRRLSDLGATPGDPPVDWYRKLVSLALVPQTGKAQLYPKQVEISLAATSFPAVNVAAANLSHLLCHPEPAGDLTTLLIDPHNGRFASHPAGTPAAFRPLVERYRYGFAAQIGAGTYPRRPIPAPPPARTAFDGTIPDGGVLQGDGLLIPDNRTYGLTIESATPVLSGKLAAAPQFRPYVVLNSGGANLQPQVAETSFLIEGGWYGVNDPASAPIEGATADFTIEGAAGAAAADFDYDQVEIRSATFDPGGVRADGVRIPTLRIVVRARVRQLMIRGSIVGPIHVVKEDADDPSMVEELVVCDSIVDGHLTADGLAISSNFGTVVLESSTVLGDVRAAVLRASDSLVDGVVRVVNNQAGCFRFSASEPGPEMRLPPRYRDVLDLVPDSAFASLRFGDPEYGQLSVVAPHGIARGAEDSSEMGAYSHLRSAIRLESVRAKVDEYGPVAMLAQFLFEGDRQWDSLVEMGVFDPDPGEVEPPPPPDPGPVIPEPPAPPPDPLPTSCPDELVAPISLAASDIGGAPEFFKDLDPNPERIAIPGEPGTALAGIPFDKVSALLEFDARFGTLPEDQGWTAEGSAQRAFTPGDGVLSFTGPGELAQYSARLPVTKEAVTQVHSYFSIRLDQIPNATRERNDGFLQLVEAGRSKTAGAMRSMWVRRGSNEFHFVTTDGLKVLNSPKSEAGFRGRQHRVSIQFDIPSNRAFGSFEGRVEGFELAAFGSSLANERRSVLAAAFGFSPTAGNARGELQHFVAAGGGRFIRVWLRVDCPFSAPTLRLNFTLPPTSKGTARLKVRYDIAQTGEATRMPANLVEGTLFPDESAGRGTLELELDSAKAGQRLAITIERDSLSGDDKLPDGIRLVEATLVGAPNA